MPGRTENRPILDELTRREFLWVGGGVVASAFLAKFAIWLRNITGTPSIAELEVASIYESKDERQEFEPGWIERSLPHRPPLVSLRGEGNREIVSYICQHNTDLSEFLRLEYNSHLHEEAPGKPPSLDEYLLSFFERAQQFLADRHPGSSIPLDEVLHFAMYALSEFAYPHVEQDEDFVYQDGVYGVPFADPVTGKAWGPKVVREKFRESNLTKLPRILQIDNSFCTTDEDSYINCSGWDRLVHCVQHMFIGYLYTYASIHHLPEDKRMPRALKELIKMGDSISRERRLLTAIITGGWEVLESLWQLQDLILYNIEDGPIIATGYFDSKHVLDKLANYAGGDAGEKLAIGPQDWHNVRKILTMLEHKLQNLPQQFKL